MRIKIYSWSHTGLSATVVVRDDVLMRVSGGDEIDITCVWQAMSDAQKRKAKRKLCPFGTNCGCSHKFGYEQV